MEVSWWPGLCVGRTVFFARDARYFSSVVLHFVWCCYHGALAFRFETLTRQIFYFQVSLTNGRGSWVVGRGSWVVGRGYKSWVVDVGVSNITN